MDSSSYASDHTDRAADLHFRGVTHLGYPWKDPRPLQEVWMDMETTFPSRKEMLLSLASFEEAQKCLWPVMEGRYANEEQFDKTLFKALQKCFNTYVMLDDQNNEENSEYFKLRVSNTGNNTYAVGVARDVDCKRGLLPEQSSSSTSSSNSSGLSSPRREMHHGSCLFEKDANGSWAFTDVFAVVELKGSAKSCAVFETINSHEQIALVDLRSKHGALGQAIVNTLDGVMLYHARNGVLRFTNEEIDKANNILPHRAAMKRTLPLAVIAGNTSTNSTIPTKVRWVSCDLVIPRTCCGEFHYRVNSFGKFCVASNDESNSIQCALSLYLDTLLFGLRAAIRVLQDRDLGITRNPDPMSGMELIIGEQPLKWPVFASPIPRPNLGNPRMKISQGEIFRGELNVREILSKAKLERTSWMEFDTSNLVVPVLIKVTSKAVHPLLISPAATTTALLRTREVLGHPLLAIVEMPPGFITIMADLSKIGYSVLKPSDYKETLSSLWRGFMDLVATVLLPLAACDVIHADIRPGFDYTSNILSARGDNDGIGVQLKLIDYESLTTLDSWIAPPIHRGYIVRKEGWNAMTFVWWQCICMAYAWLEERNVVGTGKRDPSLADVRDLQETRSLPTWLPHSCLVYASKARNDRDSVLKTLEQLEKVFTERDRLRQQQLDYNTVLLALADVAQAL